MAIDAYLAIAAEHGIDPVHLALAFVTSRPFVTSNIIGATTLDQLETCLRSAEVEITPELEARFNGVDQVLRTRRPERGRGRSAAVGRCDLASEDVDQRQAADHQQTAGDAASF